MSDIDQAAIDAVPKEISDHLFCFFTSDEIDLEDVLAMIGRICLASNQHFRQAMENGASANELRAQLAEAESYKEDAELLNWLESAIENTIYDDSVGFDWIEYNSLGGWTQCLQVPETSHETLREAIKAARQSQEVKGC